MRNPAYDAASDSPKARQNFPDAFTFTVNTNTDDIFARVASGQVEDEVAQEPPHDPAPVPGSPQLHTNANDFMGYLTMNLTQPPFDDVHVRRAINFVVNRQALRKARGGVVGGRDRDPHRAQRDPARTSSRAMRPTAPTARGDLARAKAEMKLSRYDANHDGECDSEECNAHLHRSSATAPSRRASSPS